MYSKYYSKQDLQSTTDIGFCRYRYCRYFLGRYDYRYCPYRYLLSKPSSKHSIYDTDNRST